MRFHWGHGLAIGMIGFIVYIMSMVIPAMMMDFDLETEDYYAKELKFQGQIDKSQNYAQLEDKIELEQSNNEFIINMPHVADSGSIYFYRPSDKDLDRRFNLQNNNAEQRISSLDLEKGKYQLRIEWIKDKVDYYFEKNITVK